VIWLTSLRGKLALAYAAALLVALVLVAVATVVLVDRAQRATLDERLVMASRTLSALTDIRGNSIAFDADDREQFTDIVGTRMNWAVVMRNGTLLAGTVRHVSPAILAIARRGAIGLHAGGGDLNMQRISASFVPSATRPLGIAVAWDDLAPVLALDRSIALTFALSIPVLAAFAMVAGTLVAARGLRPLEAIAALASEIAEHDLSRRLGATPSKDELGRLCTTFDRMLDRLEAAFERQRRFTGDASHELRAPLAVIRAEADLMLRKPREPAEYERALRQIAAHADELEALTRDLLATARADAGLSREPLEPCDAAALVVQASRRLESLALTRRIVMNHEVSGGMVVRAHEPALRRALGCVLHNALKFARNGGTVGVRVRGDRESVTVVIEDDGPGFSAAALTHGTERFWRDDHLRSRNADGTPTGSGLGLSIANAAVTEAGGLLTLRNRDEGGATVTITLPAPNAR
jgi:signal transduction histidine kinase